MEPGDRAAQALSADERFRSRVRLAASCVVLTALAMVQSPGLLVSDTKLDLVVDPGRFLARATHLWDPIGASGQLQNQAYGYLWPMGPFFWVGSVTGTPGWAVQRLWLALVLSVAFLGAARLARAMGMRSDLAVVLTGFAFALSPRMLSTLGPISIEAWPSALAPWVLLPLVMGSERGSPRRAAALSAVAVAMVGGVNAAATFAVLPLGALWLLTRSPGRRRRQLMLWWPVFVVVGTLWWLVPLFVLGAHSPPFLDYIESAANTTFSTTLFDALRGTSDWVPYVDTNLRAGNDLIRLAYLPFDSGVVLFLGLAGIAWKGNGHRTFLGAGVLLGLFLVTMGHLGTVQGWLAPELRTALDGVLAPLRNVHKFDPVIRLPLVLGLGWLVDHAWHAARERLAATADFDLRARRVQLNGLVVAAVLAVTGASLPALTGDITPGGGFTGIPDYWQQAADWLGHRSPAGATLLLPGSSFGDYVWGRPQDEPMQSLARSRWAVRNAVPLTPPGNIRMLDAVESRFAEGQGSTGLATYLRRAGFAYLLIRNDLTRGTDVPDPVLVHQALAGSPGLRRVASFGPVVGGEAHLIRRYSRVLINDGWQSRYPAVEIYRVSGNAPFAVQAAAPPTVVGGPEDLLDLTDRGVLGDGPALLAVDAGRPASGAPWILTDGLRDVERNFGRVHDAASATRQPGDPRRLTNPARDYLAPGADRWSTVARVTGVASVSASSSMSDATALGATQPGLMPFSAVDGRLKTMWQANYRTDRASWWQMIFEAPRAVGSVRVTVGPDERQVLRIRTEHGLTPPISFSPGSTSTVRIDDPRTGTLRVEDASGRIANRLALAEVTVSGVQAARYLRLPRTPASWGNPNLIMLRAVSDARLGCATIRGDVRCVEGRAVAPEEGEGFTRQLTLAHATSYRASLEAAAQPGDAVARRVFLDQPINVTASSTGTPDPRGSILAAVDGDPKTAWTAALSDLRPTLSLNWVDRRAVTGLHIAVGPDTPARLPRRITLTWPTGQRTVEVARDGTVTFPAFRAKQLLIAVDSAYPGSSLGFDSTPSSLPVGISELTLQGVPYLPVAVPTSRLDLPCGAGPSVVVNGRVHLTSVRTTLSRLLAGRPATVSLCGGQTIALDRGVDQITVLASPLIVPRSLLLSDGTVLDGTAHGIASVHAAPTARKLTPRAAGGVVAMRENSNSGWAATQAGSPLEPVLVDGWQQGWRLRTEDPVQVRFTPDLPYRIGLLGGLLALVALVGLVVYGGIRRRPQATRDEPDALHARLIGVPAAGVVTLLAGGLLAGWVGLVVALAGLLLSLGVARRSPALSAWVLAAAVLPAALGYALQPWGGTATWAGDLAWPHYLVVLACVGLLVEPGRPAGRLRLSLRRRAGNSTAR